MGRLIHFDGTDLVIDKNIKIKVPKPDDDEITQIRNFISTRTTQLAGEGMGVSDKPIIMKIYFPFVPNLTLTDLPGLVEIALTDRGQPKDIKQRIENMALKYLRQPRTIPIVVMAGRADLNTDKGLALLKRDEFINKKSLGVITKPDLIHDSHIGNYLIGTMSKDLDLAYGYYVVRCRSTTEAKTMDINKGYEQEREYFANHNEYKKDIYKPRTGTAELSNNLNKLLVNSILELLPSVMGEITNLDMKITNKLENMGEKLPEMREAKLSILNRYVTSYTNKIIDSIESRGKEPTQERF